MKFSRARKSYLILSYLILSYLILSYLTSCASTNKIPSWYLNTEDSYSFENFITGSGEGESAEIARKNALANLSNQFFSEVQSQNNMVVNMYENSENYERELLISENNTVDSRAQLIGAEFPADFELNGIFHSIAVMDREKCFALYLQKIQKNNIQIKNLLNTAQTSANPMTQFYCSKEALEISNQNELLNESAYILKNSMEPAFKESAELFKKSSALFEKNKDKKYVKINVENDYEGIVRRALKNQIESLGFSATDSDSDAKSFFSAVLTNEITKSKITEEYTEYFANTGFEVFEENLSGKRFFSYTRTFPKEGGLSENQLLRRVCTKIEKEIGSTFCDELKAKLSW